jgi:integrase
LRHTVAVILRECGYDERTIADALGQKTIEMARLYARGADRPRCKPTSGMQRQDTGTPC